MLQCFDEVAVVQRGALMSLQRLDSKPTLDAHALPHSLSVSPLCVVGGEETELQLQGRNIAGGETAVLLKCAGGYLTPESVTSVVGSSAAAAAAEGVAEEGAGCGGISSRRGGSEKKQEQVLSCTFKAPGGAAAAGAVTGSKRAAAADTAAAKAGGGNSGSGVVWVEVSKGAYLSEARPVLLVEDPRLAEVRWVVGWGGFRVGGWGFGAVWV